MNNNNNKLLTDQQSENSKPSVETDTHNAEGNPACLNVVQGHANTFDKRISALQLDYVKVDGDGFTKVC